MITAPDIFLSYNREDQARAKLFAEAFEAEGFKVWWDVGLRTGEAYDEVTETALRTAKAVVVLWSKKSVQSRWVRAEATLADRNKTLVPCMIEPCERPIMFELTQTAELSRWDGSPTDKAWAAFLADVQRFVAKQAATTVEVPTTPLAAPTVQETLKPGQSGSAPSLAVLPFTNRSSLSEDDVFAQGMVEDVISALSQGVNVRVLGSTATANLSRAAITDLAAIGRQLGVRYLLEGNVRRVGVNLRVTTQLLEAASGAVLWAGKFDRPLAELAELQEELVMDVASNLDVQVFSVEMRGALSKPDDITAWEAVARAQAAFQEYNAASIQRSVEWATRAATIAPDYGPAVAQLADSLASVHATGGGENLELKERVRALAMRAIALSPDDPVVLMRAGWSLCFVGYPEEGIRYSENAVRRAPGGGFAHFYSAMSNFVLNRPDKAISHIGTAERLMPGGHLNWALKVAAAYVMMSRERWAEAEEAIEQSCTLNPSFAQVYVLKAVICLNQGRNEEAHQHILTAQKLGGELSSALWFDTVFAGRYHGQAQRVEQIRALWAATEQSG
jgi:TolB-like protein